ncbi:hypothetical protein [Aureispira anguillae]|uniref:Uncharacterized protein n=1 Tax=Aureispira anguillae TaxID=2864201 RepID=A0A916DU10_9BACT|nr:hypothetical protein [Aureispira anguillae]BDS12190.1 hypothetical protein AsAng_0029050 [Aureispira anguillae]
MFKWILIGSLISCFFVSFGQKRDSLRLVIALDAANDQIETSYGYWEARANVDVKVNMYSLNGAVKRLAKQYTMRYDQGEDAWTVMLPMGFFELQVKSFGFKDIKFPLRLKKDYRHEFSLELDSVSYTYKNRKLYNYIPGTLNFCATIYVQFKDGDPAEQLAFLTEVLAVEGLEHLNVLRTQKIRHANAFLVTLDIADRTPLNMILYQKMTKQPQIERGYLIGGDVTRAIELIQENSNVLFANPSFLDDPNQVFMTSSNYTKSEELERKLLRLMEEDTKTLNKINYIIEKTTPKEVAEEG